MGAVLLAAGASVGCGSAEHSATTAATGQAPTSVVASTVTRPTTVADCVASGLTATLANSGDGAAATRSLTFRITNRSSASCMVNGSFKVASYTTSGAVLEAADRQSGASDAPVAVAPGASITLVIGISDLPSGPEGECPRVARFVLTPPGGTATITVPLLTADGRGTQVVECPAVIAVGPIGQS
jgi:hypothetical protein